MRKTEYDNFIYERIGDVVFVKDSLCKATCECCFVWNHGWFEGRCENHRILFDGMYCNDTNIKIEELI